MAAVAVKNHKHGIHNAKAQFQKAITLEQVLKSPMVADPLKLYDCCPFTDGGAAVVLASEEVARKARRPIWVLASAAASDWMLIGDKRDLSRVPATERAAASAYQQAGLGPQDVDVVELHDCFTIAEIVATEGLGLFEPRHGRDRRGEGVDERRRQDAGQSVRWPQGQGTSDRRHGGGTDRGDRHAAPGRCRAAPGRRRPRRSHPYARR